MASPPSGAHTQSSGQESKGTGAPRGLALVRQVLDRFETFELCLNRLDNETHSLRNDLSEMRRERTQLEQELEATIHRNAVLVREAEERERRHAEESKRMRQHIGELHRLLLAPPDTQKTGLPQHAQGRS